MPIFGQATGGCLVYFPAVHGWTLIVWHMDSPPSLHKIFLNTVLNTILTAKCLNYLSFFKVLPGPTRWQNGEQKDLSPPRDSETSDSTHAVILLPLLLLSQWALLSYQAQLRPSLSSDSA